MRGIFRKSYVIIIMSLILLTVKDSVDTVAIYIKYGFEKYRINRSLKPKKLVGPTTSQAGELRLVGTGGVILAVPHKKKKGKKKKKKSFTTTTVNLFIYLSDYLAHSRLLKFFLIVSLSTISLSSGVAGLFQRKFLGFSFI